MEPSSNNLQEKMRTLIRCVICRGEFSELKMLTCQHLACLPCLLDIVSLNDDTFSCAECLQEILIPNGGAEGFGDSLMTKQVASMLGVNLKPPESTERQLAETSQPRTERSVDSKKSTTNEKAINARVKAAMKNRTKRGELRKELEKKAAEAVEWIQLAEKNQEYVSKKTEKFPKEVKEVEESIIKMRDKKTKEIQERIDEINKAASAKIKSLEATRRNRQEEFEKFRRETEPNMYAVRDALKDMENLIKVLSTSKKSSKTTVGKAVNKLEKLNSFGYKQVVDYEHYRHGDSVRLRINTDELESVEDLLREEKFDLVGRVVRCGSQDEKEPLTVQFPGQTVPRAYAANQLTPSLTKSSIPAVDDTVKIAEQPKRGDFEYPEDYKQAVYWFQNQSEGIYFQQEYRILTNENTDAYVTFPGGKTWKGKDTQLKLVHIGYKKGIDVTLGPGLNEPSRGFSGVTRSSVGILKSTTERLDEEVEVDFPECHSWHGNRSEIAAFRVAMKHEYVQPKLTVDVTESEWRGVNHDDVGRVLEIEHDEEDGNQLIAEVRFGYRSVHRPLKEFDVAKPPPESEEEDFTFNPFNPLNLMLAQQLFHQEQQKRLRNPLFGVQFYDDDVDDVDDIGDYW